MLLPSYLLNFITNITMSLNDMAEIPDCLTGKSGRVVELLLPHHVNSRNNIPSHHVTS